MDISWRRLLHCLSRACLLSCVGIYCSSQQVIEISFFSFDHVDLYWEFFIQFYANDYWRGCGPLAGAMQLGYDRAICVASLVADRLIGLAGMSAGAPVWAWTLCFRLEMECRNLLQFPH